ncbi:transcriptional regulator, TetR family [Micromonospora pattaloongensis]|uniref:Transcriptional regulator, TetR family n=1 Tax=Micromonospora pattaloongensis TaxID=405436 RepID=A0A1H3KDA5_9ACTN|nr:TetR/AcrR family transcriptional regulator [Micromonospora pattaloongensis]SDY49534.1 transcriptional regulator, TetR family [Micromonospora pattaloongensis]
MRQNPARRAALLDAAIEVLAREGSRGLTFRAVDTEANVPAGTASNYFANRDELINQIGARIYERLRPTDEQFAQARRGSPDRGKLADLMRELVQRMADFPSGYLALIELRLEATRRPALRQVLTTMVRSDLADNVDFHRASGNPGDATTVNLLYLALNWLILDRLTLPGVFSGEETDALIVAAVDRLASEID